MASQEFNSTPSRSERAHHDRSYSMTSSNQPSITGYGSILSPPMAISPDPMYIAASAASQIVTNEHDSQSHTWFDQHGIEPSGETALVIPGALRLVNSFLDQLLFNILAVSRSTSLASLRPAVEEVLKRKLARDAIGLADQELQEYLGGGEDEELLALHNGLEPGGDWDLELVWKRTRLRCMVYSSLGDMEEEDEDRYTEQENLADPISSQFSPNVGVVSPAVAIFLTSILEFMGEQALVVAGQAAYHRLQAKHEKDERDGTNTLHDIADRVVVDEMDVERVALDRTLGRLWRGWKKRIRAPTLDSLNRPFSRESIRSRGNSRRGSLGNEVPFSMINGVHQRGGPSLSAVVANDHPSCIPLPMGSDDIREIEIPGVAAVIDSDASVYSSDEEESTPRRPKSLIILTPKCGQLPTPISSQPQSPAFKPKASRKRADSLPSPATSQFSSPFKKRKSMRNSATAALVTPADTPVVPTAGATKEILPEKAQDEKAVDKAAEAPTDIVMEEAPADKVLRNAESDQKEKPSGLAVLIPEVSTRPESSGVESSGEKSVAESAPAEVPMANGKPNKGLVAGMVAGAAAMGIAAVAGITAATKAKAPKIEPLKIEPLREADSDVEEEAQILTSSRISVQGRISPDRQNISRTSSVRSPSVHSVRLVEVHSPTRSRHGSIDMGVIRNGGLGSPGLPPDRLPSPISRAASASPHVANSSAMSNRAPRGGATDSISEVEEPSAATESSLTTPIALPERSPLRELSGGLSLPNGVAADHGLSQDSQIPVTPSRFPDSSFVLAAAPLPRAVREISSPDVPRTPANTPFGNLQASNNTVATPASSLNPAALEHGAPPLTPLREMMEGAPDTSDEASSIAPSDARSISDAHGRSISDTQGASFVVPASSSPIDRKVPHGMLERSLSSSAQQVSREEDVTPRPDTRGKPQRRIHTSGSSSSSNTSHKIKVHRTSEESMPGGADKSQSFEQLIHSDQTIQYTLTPQNIRQIEPQGQGSASGLSPAPVYANGVELKTPSQSYQPLNKFAGLASNPPKRAVSSSVAETPRNLVSSPNSGIRVRPQQQQARDARVDRQSLGDFADFIRSTGPPGSFETTPPRTSPITNGHTPVVNGSRGLNGAARGSVVAPRSGATAVTSGPARSNSSATRLRLVARDPVVPQRNNTSDLIDFIRQGPPKSSVTETRIPRTVAPFRTTADSDQMSGAVGGRLGDLQDGRSSVASTAFSAEPMSMHSSINSQSALLNNVKSENKRDSRDVKDAKAAKRQTMKKPVEFEDPYDVPKRTTRRVKDPYAIDMSDDDEELFSDFAPKSKKQEESLIEFLNNVAPPDSNPSVFKNPSKLISRKASGTSLINSIRNSTVAPVGPTPKPSSSRSPSQRNGTPPQVIPSLPISTRYSPQSEATSSSANPRRGNYVSQLDTERNPNTKVAQKPFHPREAVAATPYTRTNDLAEFLRNTAPPPSNQAPVQPLQLSNREIPKEKEGFSRMFGRKKKIVA